MPERHSEPADVAQELQDNSNRVAIAKVQASMGPESHPEFDGVHCVDGGEVIPPERLAMGRIRCTGCQAALEHSSKLFKRR